MKAAAPQPETVGEQTTEQSNNITAKIGRKANIGGGSNAFNVSIDEVRVYNAALTAQEIQKHYVESAPRHNVVLK